MKFKIYTAPDGYVYDRKDNSGLHLYANKISISRFDTIDNYILISDPRKEAHNNDE